MGSHHYPPPYDHVQPPFTMANGPEQPVPPALTNDAAFDILDWHPAYESCQRYFLDHAQHEPGTQALCALINIRLPFQYLHHPIRSSSSVAPRNTATTARAPIYSFTNRNQPAGTQSPPPFVSLVPYIRRLIVTGFDKAAVLHGFFGDDYREGVLPHVDCERRNYLFAAKHGGWRSCKKQYDSGSGLGGADETVPFMKPLDEARMEELNAAEKAWSDWLCMEDWVLGPRAPGDAMQQHQQEQQEHQQHEVPANPRERDSAVQMPGANEPLDDGVGQVFGTQ